MPRSAGAILSGDIVQVAADLGRVSFLWSYPNMMPLSGTTVRRIADTLCGGEIERGSAVNPRELSIWMSA